MIKNVSKKLGIILGVSASIFLVSFSVFASWTGPTDVPPNENLPAPINAGDDTQLKTGALGIGGVFETDTHTHLAIDGGNVGIGTTGPGARLDIKGNTNDGSTNVLQWRDSDNSVLGAITTDGNVGIGTTGPGYLLEVDGSAGKPGGGSWSDSSDARLKTNIEDLADSLSKIMQLQPKEYDRLDREITEVGLIANDVEEVFPDWVSEREPTEEEIEKGLFSEGEKVKTLTYPAEFNAYMIKAVQEQQEMIEEQEERINQQQEMIEELYTEIEKLKK
jgi:hypothetical protein